MKLNFTSNLPPFMNDVPEIIRAFFPFVEIDSESSEFLKIGVFFSADVLNFSINCSAAPNINSEICIDFVDEIDYKRQSKRFVKNELYKYLSNLTGITLPYGSLTGVRPTALIKNGIGSTHLINNYFVSKNRAELITNVVKNQYEYINTRDNAVSIYINIPFCTTKCNYCSFISTETHRVKAKLPLYASVLKDEINKTLLEIKENKLLVRSIYVGGGTPTSLPIELLEKILKPLKNVAKEFTVEAGRPDTITSENLSLLSEIGVSRISINPQTFNNDILEKLARNHTEKHIFDSFLLARKFNFDINMDLIAGLPQETEHSFLQSVSKAIELNPENVTVHTFSLKRGSTYKNLGLTKSVTGKIINAVDKAREMLKDVNYIPYYMYRQKNTADNLENVGYTKEGKQCIYNIDYMEDASSIYSAGAGGISKFIYPKGLIERKANPKGLNEYLQAKQLK